MPLAVAPVTFRPERYGPIRLLHLRDSSQSEKPAGRRVLVLILFPDETSYASQCVVPGGFSTLNWYLSAATPLPKNQSWKPAPRTVLRSRILVGNRCGSLRSTLLQVRQSPHPCKLDRQQSSCPGLERCSRSRFLLCRPSTEGWSHRSQLLRNDPAKARPSPRIEGEIRTLRYELREQNKLHALRHRLIRVTRSPPQISIDVMVQGFHLDNRNSQRPRLGFRRSAGIYVLSTQKRRRA